MNTDTGVIRQLQEDEQPATDEVELTEEQATEALGMEPAARLPWWERLGGSLVRGKDRSRSRQTPGTPPVVAPEVAKRLARPLAASDHAKARRRKAVKAAQRANRPHVKRQSRAHGGHGR